MKRFQWLVAMVVLLSSTACGASAASYNNRGNEKFEAEEYDAALDDYTSARLEEPDLPEPYYNGGNAFYRKGDLDKAQLQLNQSVRRAESATAQQTHYNLGNTFFQQQNWAEAIEAYKEALRINPDDWDAKHNLELALRQQQQQQQQQQNQQQGEGGQGDQQQQDQSNQQGDQPQQGGQQGQDNQGQGQQDDQENPNGSGGQNQQQQQPQSGRTELTPDEAEQLLDALGQDNQTLQDRLGQRFQSQSPPPAQDW
jgi:Ca-activated chloride channel family protein